MPDFKQISEVKHLLKEKKKIVISSHNNPDGDAIGSSLALYHYLTKKGHDVSTFVPNHFPGFLSWLPGSDDMLIYSKSAKKIQKLIADADLIFCLDFNAVNRLGPAADIIERSTAKRIMIDHHIDPVESDFDFCFSNVNTSSTGELIFDFIEQLGDTEMIDRKTAEAIYTGIVTDTGSFSYAAGNPKTYRITGELVEKGVDAEKVHRLIYDTFSENRLRLLGHAITNNMIVWNDLYTAIIYLTKKDLNNFSYQVGDIEGIVNYPLMMEKVNMSLLLTERDNMIKMSFRSKGDFSVNQLARKHFKGGGHRNAAGGKSFTTMEKTIDEIKKILADYRNDLNYKIAY